MAHYVLSHYRKGQYFKVNVLDNNGKLTTPGQLKKAFQHIIDTVGGVCVCVCACVCVTVSMYKKSLRIF